MGVDSSIMLHMIKKLRANNAVRRSRIKFKKDKNSSAIAEKWKKKNISDLELQEIKDEIKTKVNKETRLYNILAIVLVILFVLGVYHFVT